MQSKSISRELAVLVLGQISDKNNFNGLETTIDSILQKAMQTLIDYCREQLDNSAIELDNANQQLIESELHESVPGSLDLARKNVRTSIHMAEQVLNGLSASLDIPRILAMADQEKIRMGAMERVMLVLKKRINIDSDLDQVMEGWRLKRLPRIDRDILRLAMVDMTILKTPSAVACNEAVELAHRYSDEQGRKMINGILRRVQNANSNIA